MQNHYNKHYGGYCDNLSELITNTKYADMELIDIVNQTEPIVGNHASNPIYNNAAQVWNHEFYFNQFPSNNEISPTLQTMIASSFSDMAGLKKMMKQKFTSFFGVGWVWLVLTQHKQWDAPILQIVTTRDGDTITNESDDFTFNGPILTLDIWEHAYYVDYQSNKAEHFDNVWELIDWSVVSERYDKQISTLFDYTKPFEL
jgi:Fe-Mn family superoxide dismutase